MMRASWKAYVLGILVLTGGAAILRATTTPASRDSAQTEKAPPTLKDVENQLRDQNLQVARSEQAQIFLRKDVAELERLLKDPKDIKDFKAAVALFRAGIFLLDREALKSYSAEDQRRLFGVIVRFVDAQKESTKSNAALSVTLALRLLGKLPAPPENSLDRKLVLSLLEPGLDKRRSLIAVELVARWDTLPPEDHERIRRDLLTPDAHTARTAVNLITMVKDSKAKAALLGFMAENFVNLHDLARPLALKAWVSYRHLIKKDFSGELAKAKQRNDDYWEDAAISVIESIEGAREHETYLRNLHAKTTNPLIQQRVASLLGRMPARDSSKPPTDGERGSQ